MSRWVRQLTVRSLAAASLAVLAPAAEAGYTAVKQPKRQSEVSHEQILERVYGGDFVSDAAGLSFSNSSGVTVTRLEDTLGATAAEAVAGKTVSARAVAAFSGRRKTAGYFGARSGGQVQKLFDVAGRQFDVGGAADAAVAADGELVLAKARGRGVKTFSSIASANRGGTDQVVAYEVKGTSGQQASVYLLCWEDRFANRSDRDYNDLVIEVQAAEAAAREPMSQPLLIPLPPGAWTGLAGLLGLGLISSLRRPLWRFA